MVEIINWVAMVVVPAVAGLFRMMTKQKKEMDLQILSCRDALSEFKLHVARNYVSINYLKDVENRLTDHLLRIEKKLDDVGRQKK